MLRSWTFALAAAAGAIACGGDATSEVIESRQGAYSAEDTEALTSRCREEGGSVDLCGSIVSMLVPRMEMFGCSVEVALGFVAVVVAEPLDFLGDFARLDCVQDGRDR